MDFSIDRILFPTDFSENAEQAFPFAVEIAVKTGAEIILFHTAPPTRDTTPDFESASEQEHPRHFNEFLSSFDDERYKDLDISTITDNGQPVAAICKQIQKQDADLMVMGTKGNTNDRNVILGSVTSRVIQKATIPVLAVPSGCTIENFKNIIFTTDFKEGDPLALQQTISFAELFNSKVKVLHVSDQKNLNSEIRFRGFRELATENIGYDKMEFYHNYDLDFFPTIGEFVRSYPDSLLVMVRYKKTFWEMLTKRNHSKEMAFYAKVPLLVLIGDSNLKPDTIIQTVNNQK